LTAILLLEVTQSLSKTLIWAHVDEGVRRLVEKLAKAKGVTISEYVRSLVLADLDKRSLFTTQLKKEAELE